MIVNPDVDSCAKTLNHWKIFRKTQKNNLLKTKWILKPKYHWRWRSGFHIFFLLWFRSNSFAYFSSLTRRSNISIRKTLERIRKSYLFSENDLKHEITLANNLVLKESKGSMSLEQIVSFLST